MKVLYLSHHKVNDINASSGTVYHVLNMLKTCGYDVVVIDDLKISKAIKLLLKVVYSLLRKKTLIEREPLVLKSFARQIKKKTKNIHYDIIFSPSSLYYSYYKGSKPQVFYTDATFGGLIDYYLDSSNYTKRCLKNGFEQENLALKHCDMAIYASDWARETAIKIHDANPQKCYVVNRGANIRNIISVQNIEEIIMSRNISKEKKKCQMMFLGADWNRKGGDFGLEVVKILNKSFGIETVYVVVGCSPSVMPENKDYVEVVGYLDKSQKANYEKLEAIFKTSDFFLLPTRKECQGISYAEASSWALPVIATNTGGVSGIVKNKINGLLFELEDSPYYYAEKIYEYIKDPARYVSLAKSSFDFFYKYLTWESVGDRIKGIIDANFSN